MLYHILANLTVIIHFFFIAFVALGGFLIFRFKRLVFLHVPAVLWAVLVEFKGWICPLTPLEQLLRNLAGRNGYSGGFIEHYLVPLIYPEGMTPSLHFTIGGLLVLLNGTLYGIFFYKISNKNRHN